MKEADGTRLHQAAGKDGNGHEHEDVERIAVVPEGARQKAVVAGIVDGAVQHAVEAIDAELLVELVLVALVGGDLDDRGELVGRPPTGGDVVPGVKAAGLLGEPCTALRRRGSGNLLRRRVATAAGARCILPARPSGGTADAVDSKSTGGNPVRVRISPRAFTITSYTVHLTSSCLLEARTVGARSRLEDSTRIAAECRALGGSCDTILPRLTTQGPARRGEVPSPAAGLGRAPRAGCGWWVLCSLLLTHDCRTG